MEKFEEYVERKNNEYKAVENAYNEIVRIFSEGLNNANNMAKKQLEQLSKNTNLKIM